MRKGYRTKRQGGRGKGEEKRQHQGGLEGGPGEKSIYYGKRECFLTKTKKEKKDKRD